MSARPAIPDFERELRRNMGSGYHRHLEAGKKRLEGSAGWPRMTEPEVAALHAFTTGDKDWGYYNLNEALWDAQQPGGAPVPRKYEVYRLTLLAALDRLLDYPAKGLMRGVDLSQEKIARYVPGRIVPEHGFTSTSITKAFRGGVQFRIDGLHGKHIEQISAHPQEREVLFKAGTRFRVVNRHEQNGTIHIHLEEVDDD